MSIGEWINGLVGGDKPSLFVVEPPFRSDPVERSLLVSEEIWDLLENPPQKWATRFARLRADLQSFVSGGFVSVSKVPFTAKEADLGLLAPAAQGVWDLRSRNPSPGLRLLGGFAAKDMFVALLPAARSRPVDCLRHGPLGDKNSAEWRAAIRETRAIWRRLIPNYPMIGGDDVSELLSGDKIHVVGGGGP